MASRMIITTVMPPNMDVAIVISAPVESSAARGMTCWGMGVVDVAERVTTLLLRRILAIKQEVSAPSAITDVGDGAAKSCVTVGTIRPGNRTDIVVGFERVVDDVSAYKPKRPRYLQQMSKSSESA